MKVLRILGIGVGALVLLLALAVAVLYSVFDAKRIKSELEKNFREQKQRQLAIGQLELSLWPNVGIKLGQLTISEHNSQETFLRLDAVRLSVAVKPLLSKQIVVNTADIQGLDATLIRRKDGSLNIADLLAPGEKSAAPSTSDPAPTEDSATSIDISGVKIANANIVWRDEQSKSSATLSKLNLSTSHIQADARRKTLKIDRIALSTQGTQEAYSFDLKLDTPGLMLDADTAQSESLNLSATLKGKGQSIDARLALDRIERNPQRIKAAQAKLDIGASLPHKSGERHLKLHLTSPLEANPSAQTVALETIQGSLETEHPVTPAQTLKLAFDGKARADLAKKTAAVDLATRFDDSKIAAKLKATKFQPLALAVDLDIDRLNLDRYLAAAPPGDKTGVAAPAPKPADDTLDFSALKAIDASANLHVGILQVMQLKLNELTAKINLNGGRLQIAPLDVKLYEGSASGSLSIDANRRSVGLKQNLVGVSINPLMKDFGNRDLLEGRSTIALDVVMNGASVGALKKSMQGSASFSIKDGAVKGINLAQSLRDLKAKMGLNKPQSSEQSANIANKTDFSELTASLKIANGVAHNDDLAMKSPFIRLAGAGDLDIGAGRMNYLAKASVVNTEAGQGGKELEQLKGLTIPIRIDGPFEKLSYKIDLASLYADSAKVKVEDVKVKVEDALKSKLKGLFGK